MINILLGSCTSGDLPEPSSYKLTIKNNYFEAFSIEIDSLKIGNLLVGQVSKSIDLVKKTYEVRCITKSNLLLKTQLDLKGTEQNIIVRINKKGKIVLDN